MRFEEKATLIALLTVVSGTWFAFLVMVVRWMS